MKKNYLILIMICIAFIGNAQDTLQVKQIDTSQINKNLIQDPYLNMKPFNTIDMALSYLNINSNNIQFGDYTLKNGKYYHSSSIGMYIHLPNIFQMNNLFGKGKAIANIKTGFLMDFTSTDLIDIQINYAHVLVASNNKSKAKAVLSKILSKANSNDQRQRIKKELDKI